MPKLTLLKARPVARGQTEFTFQCVKGGVTMQVTLVARSEELAREEATLIFREQVQAEDEVETRIRRVE